MGSSRKKIVKKQLKQTTPDLQNPNRQQILQCLQNKCSVEVENISYILHGKRSIRLSDLPDWYYSDECFDYDDISTSVSVDQNTGENECTSQTDKLKSNLNHSDGIQIMDTFSLASQVKLNVKTEKNDSSDIPFFDKDRSNKEVMKISNQSNLPIQIIQTNTQNQSMFEDMNSVFHSSALDDLLAVETKKIDDTSNYTYEIKTNSGNNVIYNTPSCQSSYVKTLQTALMERERKGHKYHQLPKDFIFDTVPNSKVLSSGLQSSGKKLSTKKKKINSLLQHLTQNLINFSLSALEAKLKNENHSISVESANDTANAIKKRFSKAVDIINAQNKKILQENCKNLKRQLSNECFSLTQPSKEMLEVLKPKTKLKLLQKISLSLASKASSALKVDIISPHFRKNLLTINTMPELRKSNSWHTSLTSLKPISLKQAFGKYLIYLAKKWSIEKLCCDYKTFCFNKLPVQLTKVKLSSPHFQAKICRHKLDWKEVKYEQCTMIFPEAYSVPDDTIMHAEDDYGNVTACLTCARTREVPSCFLSKKEKMNRNLKIKLSQPVHKEDENEKETDIVMNLLGNVMVIQLANLKNSDQNSGMIVKIMSFCDWNRKAEEIMTIIIENHFELQSMQRGRYIRTIIDGYLLEVLRDSAHQVTHKNMPLDVQLQLSAGLNPSISLVKISSKMDYANVDSDQLINFTEAIDSMLKLDKELAKPKVNMALKLRDQVNCSEKKVSPAKSLKLDIDNGFEISVEETDRSSFDTKNINLNHLLKKIVQHRSKNVEKVENCTKSEVKHIVGTVGSLQNEPLKSPVLPVTSKNMSTFKHFKNSQSIQISNIENSTGSKSINSDFNHFHSHNNMKIDESPDPNISPTSLSADHNMKIDDSLNLNPILNTIKAPTAFEKDSDKTSSSLNMTRQDPILSEKDSDKMTLPVSQDSSAVKKNFIFSPLHVSSMVKPDNIKSHYEQLAMQSKPSTVTSLTNCAVAKIKKNSRGGKVLNTFLAIPIKVIPLDRKPDSLTQVQQSATYISSGDNIIHANNKLKDLSKTITNCSSENFDLNVQNVPNDKNCFAVNFTSKNLLLNSRMTTNVNSSTSVSGALRTNTTPSKMLPKFGSTVSTIRCKSLPTLKKIKTKSGKWIAFPEILRRTNKMPRLHNTTLSSSRVVNLHRHVIVGPHGNWKQSKITSSSRSSASQRNKPTSAPKPALPFNSHFFTSVKIPNSKVAINSKVADSKSKLKSKSQKFVKVKENDFVRMVCVDNEVLTLCNFCSLEASQVYSKIQSVFQSESPNLSVLNKKDQLNHLKKAFLKSLLKQNHTDDNTPIITEDTSIESLKSSMADILTELARKNAQNFSNSFGLASKILVESGNSSSDVGVVSNASSENFMNLQALQSTKSSEDLFQSKDRSADYKSLLKKSLSECSERNTLLSQLADDFLDVCSLDETERDEELQSSRLFDSAKPNELKAIRSYVPIKPKKLLSDEAFKSDGRRILAEKRRRFIHQLGFRKLLSCLSFKQNGQYSKMTILSLAVSQIKFLEMESKNISFVKDILMEINYKLQFQLEILQNGKFTSADMLNDLEELRCQIVKEKRRLVDIQNKHQTDTMALFKLQKAEVNDVILLNPVPYQSYEPFGTVETTSD